MTEAEYQVLYDSLNDSQKVFYNEYQKNRNQAEAYSIAYNIPNIPEKSQELRAHGSRLMRSHKIREMTDYYMQKKKEKNDITVEMIKKEVLATARNKKETGATRMAAWKLLSELKGVRITKNEITMKVEDNTDELLREYERLTAKDENEEKSKFGLIKEDKKEEIISDDKKNDKDDLN